MNIDDQKEETIDRESTSRRASATLMMVAASAIAFIALRGQHAEIAAAQTRSLPIHLLAIFGLCSSVVTALAFGGKFAWVAARLLAGCAMVIFTLGLAGTAYILARDEIRVPWPVLQLTLWNPAMATSLFLSLGGRKARRYFCGAATTTSGKVLSVALLSGLALTGMLYMRIRPLLSKEYAPGAYSGRPISFEIREAAPRPVAGFSQPPLKHNGPAIFVHSTAAFSNKDVRIATVVEDPADVEKSSFFIKISFTEESAKRFAHFTGRLVHPPYAVPTDNLRSIAVLIEGEVWLAASVGAPVESGSIMVPCPFSRKEDAMRIAGGITAKNPRTP